VVSVRSSANSLEILNFNLYLTPTDVWTGELRNTGSGVELYSEDDNTRDDDINLHGSSTNALSRRYITNPLVN